MIIKNIHALGLYGGASLNAIEMALIDSDGVDVYNVLKTEVVPYPENLALNIRTIISHRLLSYAELENCADVQNLRTKVSEFYAETIANFCNEEKVDIIGVDSLTIGCDAANKCSYQIEDGQCICNILQRRIITHFHKADLLAGGQTSPLMPAFVNAIGQKENKPALFIYIGAVSSLVYLGESGEMQAFDCAPGLAMIEDWTFRHAKMQTDYNGKLAATGNVHQQILQTLLRHKFLHMEPPKALDIMRFSDKKEHLEGLSLEDGAATATAFIAEAIYQAALDFLPKIPATIYVVGAGIKNPTLCRFIKQSFAPREPQILLQWRTLGASATAFNAVRRLYALPITFPTTTGAYEPLSGGEFYEVKE